MDTKPIVRELVEKTVLARTEVDSLRDDEPLLDGGLIDSMGIFELVSALEAECRIRIDDDEIVPDNFGSIDSITSLVEKKLPA